MTYNTLAFALLSFGLLGLVPAQAQETGNTTLTIDGVSPHPVPVAQQVMITGANIPSSFTIFLSGQFGSFQDSGASDTPSRGFFALPQSIPTGSYGLTLGTSTGVRSNTIAVEIGTSGTTVPTPTPPPFVPPTPKPTVRPNPPRDQSCICPLILAPVCGVNNKTYANQCEAQCSNVAVAFAGVCPGDQDFIDRYHPPGQQINPAPVKPRLKTECEAGAFRCLSAVGQIFEQFGGRFDLRDAVNLLQTQLGRVAAHSRPALEQLIRELR